MAARIRLIGSPEKLVDEVIERARRNAEARMNEALEAARKILDKAFEESLSRLEEELRRSARSASERLESFAARHEVELRKKIAKLRAEAVEEALRQALEKLRSTVGEEEYTGFLARLLEEAARRLAAEYRELVVVPAGPDREAVKRAVKRARLPGGVKASLADETVEGIGGFIIRARGGPSLDYRLDVVLSTAVEEARSRIASILFEE
ncbi:hypothetical protein CF15_05245 [Pyrodictium occultum]|uniref:Uncharacterized protein n=1 Tax=Pyrodictium occultum TaxID=2309 RepID=A0A0V8RVY0_PYROC|nr:V-type ATP synthase subunit E [Pyrodictium occultum]KSW12168.1 hypothetical protein CF15_05245 [Pyrodictium occultum]